MKLSDISTMLNGGFHLERGPLLEQVTTRISEGRFVLLTGCHGTGRAALARHSIERLNLHDEVCCFRGEELASNSLSELLLERGADLERVKIFLILGLDKFLARDQRETVFAIFERLKWDPRAKLIATCHHLFAEFCRVCIAPQIAVPVSEIRIPGLNVTELRKVLDCSRSLQAESWLLDLPSEALTLYSIRIADSLDWSTVLEKPKSTREFQELLRQELTCRLGDESVFLHQAFEEWCLLHWLDQRFVDCDHNMQTFAESLPTHLALRQATRAWLGDLADSEPKKAGFLVEGALRDLEQPLCYRYDVLQTLLTHPRVEELLVAVITRFRADDALLLRRLLVALERYNIPRTVLPAKLWTAGWTETEFLKNFPRAARVECPRKLSISKREIWRPRDTARAIDADKAKNSASWANQYWDIGFDNYEPERWKDEFSNYRLFPINQPSYGTHQEWLFVNLLTCIVIRFHWDELDETDRQLCFDRVCYILQLDLENWDPLYRQRSAVHSPNRRAASIFPLFWEKDLTANQQEGFLQLFPRILTHPNLEVRCFLVEGLVNYRELPNRTLLGRCLTALVLEERIVAGAHLAENREYWLANHLAWSDGVSEQAARLVADAFWALDSETEIEVERLRSELGRESYSLILPLLRVLGKESSVTCFEDSVLFGRPRPRNSDNAGFLSAAADRLSTAMAIQSSDRYLSQCWAMVVDQLTDKRVAEEAPFTEARRDIVLDALYGSESLTLTVASLLVKPSGKSRRRLNLLKLKHPLVSLFAPDPVDAVGPNVREPAWLLSMLTRLKDYVDQGYVLPPYVLRQCETYLAPTIVKNPAGLKVDNEPDKRVLWFLELCVNSGSKSALQLAVDFTTAAI